jgi:hypothetical protein
MFAIFPQTKHFIGNGGYTSGRIVSLVNICPEVRAPDPISFASGLVLFLADDNTSLIIGEKGA